MAGPEAANSVMGPKQSPANSDEFNQALSEFQLMLRYVLSDGIVFDEETQKAVAAVSSTSESDKFIKLMAAHGALSKIIAPITPRSLKATEPATGWLGSLRRPPLILAMISIAIISAIGFTVTHILYGHSKGFLGEKLHWCFAAALGAVFYVLFTAHGYVKDRTFDPRYNTVYVVRFVLGVLSGFILAIMLQAPLFSKNENIGNLGPAMIALLGGFSTEAVYQILQRLVDMLLAAVRGDDSGAAQEKASQAARKELLALADDPGMPSEMKSKAIAAAKKVGA